MAQSNKTKKFEARHLSDTLKRRKEFSKVKQRHQANSKRKEKRAAENGSDEETDDVRPAKKQKSSAERLDEMTVDDFFAGGVPLPEKTAKARKADKKAEKKRKRGEEDEDSDSAASEAPVFDSDEGDAEEEDADATGTHAGDLKALAAKDPEFYKYLKENDAELLDFAETADLGEIDDLSGSEDDQTTSKKKNKDTKSAFDDDGELTVVVVKKWTAAMAEQNSLRAMREMVLAFRAAAHLNEEDGKQYKYTISDANGMSRICILF